MIVVDPLKPNEFTGNFKHRDTGLPLTQDQFKVLKTDLDKFLNEETPELSYTSAPSGP